MMAVMYAVTAVCQRCTSCRAWAPLDELTDISDDAERLPFIVCASCARRHAEEQREEHAQDIEF